MIYSSFPVVNRACMPKRIYVLHQAGRIRFVREVKTDVRTRLRKQRPLVVLQGRNITRRNFHWSACCRTSSLLLSGAL